LPNTAAFSNPVGGRSSPAQTRGFSHRDESIYNLQHLPEKVNSKNENIILPVECIFPQHQDYHH
jgi:hypothetical protein